MSSSLTWRFNEGTIIPEGAVIGGFIEDATPGGGGITTVPNGWYCYTTSSSNAISARTFWWFDTSHIPDSATIVSVQFRVRYSDAYTDTGFGSLVASIYDNAFGTTITDADFAASNSGGVAIGSDAAPVINNFFDTGVVTAAAALAKVSKTAYTNVVMRMEAGDVTSAYVEFSAPSGWRSTLDVVPRLIVTFLYDDATYVAGIPSVVGVPTWVYTP